MRPVNSLVSMPKIHPFVITPSGRPELITGTCEPGTENISISLDGRPLGAATIDGSTWKLPIQGRSLNAGQKIEAVSGRNGRQSGRATVIVVEVLDDLWCDFESEGRPDWDVGTETEFPGKSRGTHVSSSISFHSEGKRCGSFEYRAARGANVAAAYFRRTSKPLTGYSSILMDVANPRDEEVTLRLGVSTDLGDWTEYEGVTIQRGTVAANRSCPSKGRATLEFDLDDPIQGSRVDSGLARLVLILSGPEHSGRLLVDNIRFRPASRNQ